MDRIQSINDHSVRTAPRDVRASGGSRLRRALVRSPRSSGANAPKGLNENYGRELLELHTLGVDGGYTQKDVTEVARAFTGWSIANPRQGGGFRFVPQLHDEGEKVVLGHRIKAGGGEHDGEEVLDILANHPATARFISTKLARRFVSDTPPQALIDRATDTFRETHGDLRAVMATILRSPEFLSADAYRAKVKSPFEFIVSAVRTTGAEVQRCAADRPHDAATRHAAVSVPAADRIQRHCGRVGEHRRAGESDERCARDRQRTDARRIHSNHAAARIGARREHVGYDPLDDCKGCDSSAGPRTRARLAGVSTPIRDA